MLPVKERPFSIKKPFSFPSEVKGIPCRIKVLTYHRQPPDPTTWASDLDFYGYREIEWELLDRKGYPAPWLERKLYKDDHAEIEQRIIEEVEVDEY